MSSDSSKGALSDHFSAINRDFFTFHGFRTPHARFTSRIDWFYAAKHGASSPGSSGVEPRRFPVWAVLVDLAHLAKVDSRAQTTP